MNYKKPDLYTIEGALIDDYPESTVNQFVLDIKNGLKPSEALRNFVTENKCTELHSTVIFDLLRKAYKDIVISDISFPITDSGYPFYSSDELSDEDFDNLITRALP